MNHKQTAFTYGGDVEYNKSTSCTQGLWLCLSYLFCCLQFSKKGICPENPAKQYQDKITKMEMDEVHDEQVEEEQHNLHWKLFYEAYSQLKTPIIITETQISRLQHFQKHATEIVYANDAAALCLGYLPQSAILPNDSKLEPAGSLQYDVSACPIASNDFYNTRYDAHEKEFHKNRNRSGQYLVGININDLMPIEDRERHDCNVARWIRDKNITRSGLQQWGKFIHLTDDNENSSPIEPNLLGFMLNKDKSVDGQPRMLTLLTANGSKKSVHGSVSFFGCVSGHVKAVFQFIEPERPFVFNK